MKHAQGNHIKAAMLILLVLLTVGVITGCGGGGGGGGEGSADPTSTSTSTEYGNITGAITDENGAAAEGVEVSWGIYSKGEKSGSTYTDSNGQYTLNNLPSGTNTITAVKDEDAISFSVTVVVNVTTQVPVKKMEPVGTISGTVTDADTGSGISSATVSVVTSGWGVTISKSSETDGTFYLPYVEEGTHTLTVSKSGYSNATTSVTVYAGSDTAVPESETILGESSTPTPTSTTTATPTPSTGVQWTVLVYFAADNSLEGYDLDDINEMEKAGSTDQVNIIAQSDRSGSSSYGTGGWAGCRRYYITKDSDTSSINSTLIQDLGTINSGDPDQLESFIKWGIQNYPADKYAVIIWNHGSGWQGRTKGKIYRAIAEDDSSGGDYIDQLELKQVFQNVYSSLGAKLDLIGMDACVMGNVEVAYDFINTGKYITFSQASEEAPGWAYDLFLQSLVSDPTCDGAALGTYIVNAFAQEYGYNSSLTLSTIDLSKVSSLTSSISTFVQSANDAMDSEQSTFSSVCQSLDSVDYYYTDYKDLDALMEYIASYTSDASVATAAQSVRTILAQAVVAEFHGYSVTANGLSIWVPDSTYYSYYSSEYSDLGFASTTQWADFLDQVISSGGGGGGGGDDWWWWW